MKYSNSIKEFVAILEIQITMNNHTDVLNPILSKKLTKKEVDDQLSKCGQNKTQKQMYTSFYYYCQNFKKDFKKMKKELKCTLENIGDKNGVSKESIKENLKGCYKDHDATLCHWNDNFKKDLYFHIKYNICCSKYKFIYYLKDNECL
ncbi:Plasmodium exported protein, unknown function [Plasmodium ovale]|uniref:RAD protein (Pv-fam-e) n=2 Tax=Plasmodium ovale TaxID=36330 RepID=A0A1A8X560_PLAOA|nr:RAD protein (Pv-fam-e) [Plasmodium ovale curtisi]SBS99737.1 RAD protein (Pv-fam-e) [Plasmodium ovale curtisi]SBT84705.1 Plasmodium exported protein, unknown function [Plasmodium ovale]